jgi:hypothetical protein
MKLLRFQACLAGLWAGSVMAVGGVAAPSLFMVLERQQAGLGAGRIFATEANISMAIAIVLFLIERRRVRDLAESSGSSQVMTGNLMLTLVALFLTVFGQYALHPLIQAAKEGQPTALSFGALHGISAGLYWLKAIAITALAWRLTGTRA